MDHAKQTLSTVWLARHSEGDMKVTKEQVVLEPMVLFEERIRQWGFAFHLPDRFLPALAGGSFRHDGNSGATIPEASYQFWLDAMSTLQFVMTWPSKPREYNFDDDQWKRVAEYLGLEEGSILRRYMALPSGAVVRLYSQILSFRSYWDWHSKKGWIPLDPSRDYKGPKPSEFGLRGNELSFLGILLVKGRLFEPTELRKIRRQVENVLRKGPPVQIARTAAWLGMIS